MADEYKVLQILSSLYSSCNLILGWVCVFNPFRISSQKKEKKKEKKNKDKKGEKRVLLARSILHIRKWILKKKSICVRINTFDTSALKLFQDEPKHSF